MPVDVPEGVDPFAFLNRGVKFTRGKVCFQSSYLNFQ